MADCHASWQIFGQAWFLETIWQYWLHGFVGEGGAHLEHPAVMDGADESDFWSRRYAEYAEGFSDYDGDSEDEYDDDVSDIVF